MRQNRACDRHRPRLDGGGFAVVAPVTDCKGAVELGERLRERVEANVVAWDGAVLD
jgi:PleD family two-component response regulator